MGDTFSNINKATVISNSTVGKWSLSTHVYNAHNREEVRDILENVSHGELVDLIAEAFDISE